MAEIQCFLLTETEYVQRTLRRYRSSEKATCRVPRFGYCDGRKVLCEKLLKPRESKSESVPKDDLEAYKRAPTLYPWPTVCDFCGEPFRHDDEWQVWDRRLYENTERGILCTLHEAPVGAMWFAPWLDGWGSEFWKARGGGPHLIVKTPAGDWDMDMVSNNGPGWERTGDPPNVTANPSIGFQNGEGGWRYHAWLRDGRLIDC